MHTGFVMKAKQKHMITIGWKMLLVLAALSSINFVYKACRAANRMLPPSIVCQDYYQFAYTEAGVNLRPINNPFAER